MDIKLDTNWDIEIANSDLSLTEGREGIQQHLSQRLKTFFGEYFLNNKIGVPYLQQICVKGYNPIVVDSILKNVVINTPGIIRITKWNILIDRSLRQLYLIFRASTDDGIIDFEGAIP